MRGDVAAVRLRELHRQYDAGIVLHIELLGAGLLGKRCGSASQEGRPTRCSPPDLLSGVHPQDSAIVQGLSAATILYLIVVRARDCFRSEI